MYVEFENGIAIKLAEIGGPNNNTIMSLGTIVYAGLGLGLVGTGVEREYVFKNTKYRIRTFAPIIAGSYYQAELYDDNGKKLAYSVDSLHIFGGSEYTPDSEYPVDKALLGFMWTIDENGSIGYLCAWTDHEGKGPTNPNLPFVGAKIVNKYAFQDPKQFYGESSNDPFFNAIKKALIEGEPPDDGGNSGPGGGTGTFDGSSDPITFPGLPSLSATDVGLVTIYKPTGAQMQAFLDYLYSSAFDIASFKKIFADPMDMIIGLSIVPVDVPAGPGKIIRVGGISTDVAMTTAAKQYVTVPCGAVHVQEYWGSALDYAPYTKCSIFLPYIGTREIKTDDIMGKTVAVQYNVDILSGACTAMVKCGGSVLYSFSGSCSLPVPVSSTNWTQLITGTVQLAGAGITAATTGSPAGLISAAATAVTSAKPNVQRSGGVSGAAGLMGIQSPYLIVEFPRQSLARNYRKMIGAPSNITENLSKLSGFTKVGSIHLSGIPATEPELQEIETLLKEGVIL